MRFSINLISSAPREITIPYQNIFQVLIPIISHLRQLAIKSTLVAQTNKSKPHTISAKYSWSRLDNCKISERRGKKEDLLVFIFRSTTD